jgi:hypothetical protein
MQAAIGCAQLEKFTSFVERRRNNFDRLKAALDEVSDKLIKLMRDEIYHYFNERSILVDVSFKFPYFILDFTVKDDDCTSGQVVNIKLEDIISNMIAYKLEFDDAMISVLTYKTLQA